MTRNNAELHIGAMGNSLQVHFEPNYDLYEDAMSASEETMPKHPSLVKLYSDDPIFTGQSGLDATTVSSYRKTGSNELPLVFTHKGRLWIHDGHHRIVASRLNKDPYILVKHWVTGE